MKLSKILSQPVVHCEFEKTTTLFFADGGMLFVEFSQGQYSEYTQWDDIEVNYDDSSGKRFSVEVDTKPPVVAKRKRQ